MLIGVKEADTHLLQPSQWDIEGDKQMMKYEQPLQVARYTKTTGSDTEEAKYMIKIREFAKFMEALTTLSIPTSPKATLVFVAECFRLLFRVTLWKALSFLLHNFQNVGEGGGEGERGGEVRGRLGRNRNLGATKNKPKQLINPKTGERYCTSSWSTSSSSPLSRIARLPKLTVTRIAM